MDAYRRNELPYTYNLSKVMTNEFIEWLVKTAKARGIEYLEDHAHEHSTNRNMKPKMSVSQIEKLAKQINDSKETLDDTSGLESLSGAISARKEITAWYRFNGASDDEHPHFIQKLIEIRDMLSHLTSNARREHNLPTEGNPVVVSFTPTGEFQGDEESDEDEVASSPNLDSHSRETPSALRREKKPLNTKKTKEQVTSESNSLVFCFLYDFNVIRARIQQIWLHYHSREINLITAAILTDVAQGIIQRNVTATVEELEELTEERSLADIVKQLFETVSPTSGPKLQTQEPSDRMEKPSKVADLFCIDAIAHMEEYQRLKALPYGRSGESSSQGFPHMAFLLFFDNLREERLKAPFYDNFTRAMGLSTTGSEPWLPFGLQIVLDLQAITKDQFHDIHGEITEGYIQLINVMRDHVEYEDRIWATGVKPEYMGVGDTKFSNSFLEPVADLVTWLANMNDEKNDACPKLIEGVHFISRNPVWGGLVLYHFHRKYHCVSIGKTQWFMVSILHLYNSCRQVGGLPIPWPDLEHIIETHGTERIFVGGRPTDPDDFYHRLMMATCVSSRSFVKEFTQRNAEFRRTDQNTTEKRGLPLLFPLQMKIFEYYYNYSSFEDRWIHLHNLFAHTHERKDTDHPVEKSALTKANDLRVEFRSMMESMKPKGRKKGSNKSKTEVLDLPPESLHAELLHKMEGMLRSSELYSNFDHLSFFRRAFEFIHRIRGEVLFDSTQALMTLDAQNEDPNNFQLLCRLLKSLRIQAKDLGIKVIGTEKVQKISKMMEEFIRKEGRTELDNAERLLGRWSDAREPAAEASRSHV
jgi:hypothetical protein